MDLCELTTSIRYFDKNQRDDDRILGVSGVEEAVNSTLEAKSRKYQGVFEMKSGVKTWQVRGIWSQQLEHKQVPQWGTEPGVRKGKCSLLACHTRCKCSMETTHNR